MFSLLSDNVSEVSLYIIPDYELLSLCLLVICVVMHM